MHRLVGRPSKWSLEVFLYYIMNPHNQQVCKLLELSKCASGFEIIFSTCLGCVQESRWLLSLLPFAPPGSSWLDSCCLWGEDVVLNRWWLNDFSFFLFFFNLPVAAMQLHSALLLSLLTEHLVKAKKKKKITPMSHFWTKRIQLSYAQLGSGDQSSSRTWF